MALASIKEPWKQRTQLETHAVEVKNLIKIEMNSLILDEIIYTYGLHESF